MLGAILLSDRTHYAYVIEEGLRAEDFYRERHRTIYESVLALFAASEPIDVLTVTEHLRSRGKLDDAGGQARDRRADRRGRRASATLRHYAPDRQASARCCAGCSRRRYEIQAAVHGHEGAPRDLVERAERTVLEVAHDDRQKDFRKVGDVLHDEIGKWQKLSTEGRASPARRRASPTSTRSPAASSPATSIILAARPSMGKSALVTNIAENVALDKDDPRPVALFALEMSEAELAQRFIASQAAIKGDDLRKGRLKDESKWKRVLRVAGRLRRARRSTSTTPPTSASSTSAPRPGACTSSRPTAARPDHRRLPAADARRRAHREPRPAGRRDEPRAEDPRARARSAGDRALAALPRRRVAHRQAPDALRPARVGPDRAGRRPRDVHLPRRVLQPGDHRAARARRELIIAKHRNGGLGDVPLTFQNEYPRFLGLQRAA